MSIVTGRPAAAPRALAPRLRAGCPATHLLGNGRYTVWLTEAGMGRSSWQGEALSRWAGDRIEDADGWRFWLRDLGLGRTWALAPTREAARGSLLVSPGALTWSRREHGIESSLEVCVAAGLDAELRTIGVRNHTDRTRTLDVTGCLELVLHDPEPVELGRSLIRSRDRRGRPSPLYSVRRARGLSRTSRAPLPHAVTSLRSA